jgi:hypothetical protein
MSDRGLLWRRRRTLVVRGVCRPSVVGLAAEAGGQSAGWWWWWWWWFASVGEGEAWPVVQ